MNLVAPDTLVEIRYYIGKVRRVREDAKSELLYANQQKLLRFLQQKQHVTLGFGHLINYPDGSFHEKGVDILLAVEMQRDLVKKARKKEAQKRKYSQKILIGHRYGNIPTFLL